MLRFSSSSSFDATSGWILLLRIPVGVLFLWTGAEGFLAYGMARRREALGLAEATSGQLHAFH